MRLEPFKNCCEKVWFGPGIFLMCSQGNAAEGASGRLHGGGCMGAGSWRIGDTWIFRDRWMWKRYPRRQPCEWPQVMIQDDCEEVQGKGCWNGRWGQALQCLRAEATESGLYSVSNEMWWSREVAGPDLWFRKICLKPERVGEGRPKLRLEVGPLLGGWQMLYAEAARAWPQYASYALKLCDWLLRELSGDTGQWKEIDQILVKGIAFSDSLLSVAEMPFVGVGKLPSLPEYLSTFC